MTSLPTEISDIIKTELSAKTTITIPAELFKALKSYQHQHPEFNFSGFVQKCIRDLLQIPIQE